MVTITRWTGREARILREVALRMTIYEFAEHANLSTSTIRDMENKGEQAQLRGSTQKILDETLANAPEHAQQRFTAALADPTECQPSSADGRTRWPGGDGRAASVASSAQRTPSRGRPAFPEIDDIDLFDLRELEEVLRGARPGNEGLNLLEETCARIDRSYAQHSPLVVLPMVSLQMRRLVRVLGEPQQVAHRRRLCSAVGRLAGLRAWVLFDMANHQTAASWYDAAIDAAREAEDHALCGWLFGARSLIASYRHDHKAALAAVEQGQAAARNTSDGAVRAWLAALEMRARAGLLDTPGCYAARRRAERLAGASRTSQRRHGMDFDGDTLDLTYYTGTSLLLLHQPDPAAALLQASMEVLPGSHAKARAILLLSMATAAGQRGKSDEAAELVRQALTVASGQPIMPVAQRARDVRRQLGPPGAPALAALDEQLEDFADRLRTPTPALPT